jgi:Ran GTPase-activating protein (RanGAP) involved in mRNA processing and transport
VQANQALEELYLDTNQIDDDAAEALAAALAANKTLKKVDVSANRIGDAGVAALAEMLKVNGTLQELNLTSNEVGYDGARPLTTTPLLLVNTCWIALCGLRCPRHWLSTFAQTLGIAAKSPMSLATWMGSKQTDQITHAGAVALAKALAENKGLKKLAISDNYIGTLGASTIASALAQNGTLTSLALRGCELSDTGAERLCSALLVRSSIAWFDAQLRHAL